MGEWEFRNCMHGIREGLDSHECGDCNNIARDLGYDMGRGKTYLFSSQKQVDGLKKKLFEKGKKAKEKKKEPVLDGLGIYDVFYGGATYWLIAVSRKLAVSKLKEHLIDVDCYESDVETYATKMNPSKKLTFHGDTKAIKHTVEDWLVIYDGMDTSPFLACSEY